MLLFTNFIFFDILSLVIDLKVLFKNKTKYDEKIYKIFLQFHQKIYGFRYKLYTVSIIALLLFMIASQISFHKYDLAILFLFITTGFFLWRFLHPISEISKEFNSHKIQKKEEFTFTFYDKYLKVLEEENLKYYIVKYRELYKVFETQNFIYIYVDKTHAFLLDKDCFSIGNSKDFSEFIHKKCRFKYRYKSKKN